MHPALVLMHYLPNQQTDGGADSTEDYLYAELIGLKLVLIFASIVILENSVSAGLKDGARRPIFFLSLASLSVSLCPLLSLPPVLPARLCSRLV